MKRLLEAVAWLLALAALVVGLRWGQEQYLCTAYPDDYRETVQQCAEKYNFDPSLIFAVVYTESNFDAQAVSSAGAKGLMQVTDDTLDWALFRLRQRGKQVDLFDPASNIFYGTSVLALLTERFGNEDTVLAAYNAGQGNVARWLRDPACSEDGVTLSHIPYEETRAYVVRVREAQEMYRQLYGMP